MSINTLFLFFWERIKENTIIRIIQYNSIQFNKIQSNTLPLRFYYQNSKHTKNTPIDIWMRTR